MANAANCICVICATGGSQDRVVRNARQFQFTRQVAVLTNGGDPLFAKLVLDQVNLAGRTTGVDIQPITVPGPDEGLDAAFAAMAKAQAEAVVIQGSLSTKRLADLALNRRLPAASTTRAFVDAGISSLVARVLKTDGITPAAIYRLVDAKRPTLLVDAADNLGLGSIGPLRAVLNSGHRRGGSITRFVGDRPRQFSTFAPLALAAIGNLPLPVMHRSIIVQMDRHDGARELRRFDENDPALAAIYRETNSSGARL